MKDSSIAIATWAISKNFARQCLLSLLLVGAACRTEAAFTASLPDVTASPGGPFVVSINVDSISAAGFQLYLNYPAEMSYAGTFSSPLSGVVVNQFESGKLSAVWSANNDTALAGDILSLNFTAPSTIGSYPLTWVTGVGGSSFYNQNFDVLPGTFDPGSLQVVPEPAHIALGVFGGIGALVTGSRAFMRRRPLNR